MRRSKEIVILFVLLLVAASCIIGYVVNRRANNRVEASLKALQPANAAAELGPIVSAAPSLSLTPSAVSIPPQTPLLVQAMPVIEKPIALLATVPPATTPILPAPEKIQFKPVAPESVNASPSSVVPARSAPAPAPASASARTPDETVELGGANEGKTIDFTSGKPVAKETAEDKAIIEAALKDMAEAKKTVIFKAPVNPTEPAPKPVEN